MHQTSLNKELENLLTPGILQNRTILVAEDDDTNYFLIKEFLEFSKVTLIWTRDGKETLEKVTEHANIIDLILLDIQMPELNGFEVLFEIKKLYPRMPIIAITAYAISGDRERGIKAGFDEYLSKPVSRRVLMENIIKFI